MDAILFSLLIGIIVGAQAYIIGVIYLAKKKEWRKRYRDPKFIEATKAMFFYQAFCNPSIGVWSWDRF